MFNKNIYQIIKLFPEQIWSLAQVKNYMRVEADYDDDLIKSLIEAAIIAAENFTKLNLLRKLIKLTCNLPNVRNISLQYWPVQEIKKVIVYSREGAKELQANEYLVDFNNAILSLADKLGGKELIVEYVIGFDGKNIPASIKHGILLHVTEMYDRQEQGAIGLSQEIKNLYLPYRKLRI